MEASIEYSQLVKHINDQIDQAAIKNNQLHTTLCKLNTYDEELSHLYGTTRLHKLNECFTKLIYSILGRTFTNIVYNCCATYQSGTTLEHLVSVTCRIVLITRMKALWQYMTNYIAIGQRILEEVLGPNDVIYFNRVLIGYTINN